MKKFKLFNKETGSKVLFSIKENKELNIIQVKQGNKNLSFYSYNEKDLYNKVLLSVGLLDYVWLSSAADRYKGCHNLANFKYHFKKALENKEKTFIYREDLNSKFQENEKVLRELYNKAPQNFKKVLGSFMDYNGDFFKYSDLDDAKKQLQGRGIIQIHKLLDKFFNTLKVMRTIKKQLDITYGDNKPVNKSEVMTFDKFKDMYKLNSSDLESLFSDYINDNLENGFNFMKDKYITKLEKAYDALIEKLG